MYRPLDFEQIRHLEAAAHLWDLQLPMLRLQDAVAGGMQWKEAKGRQYLIRHWNDRVTHKKKSTSLGVRSPETERLFEEFQQKRDRIAAEATAILPRLERFAHATKVLRLPRLSATETDIFRALGKHHLDRELMVFSQEALHAYGASFGLAFDPATRNCSELTLYMAAPDLDVVQDGLVEVIVGAARGVEFEGGRFVVDRAAGRLSIETYSTDQLFSTLHQRFGLAAEQEDVLWDALQEEPIWAAVIGDDGLPVPMLAVPPKAFVFLALARERNAHERTLEIAKALRSEIVFHERDVEAFPQLEDMEQVGGPRV